MSTRHSDQALQRHFIRDIEALIIQNSKNQSTQEIQQITSLAKDTAMVITTLVPTNTSTTRCSARILTTTLLVPKVDTSSRTYAVRKGNRIYPANNDESRYLLLPQNNIISNSAKAFNRQILLAKRICWVDSSINVTTSKSEDPLFQNFTIASTLNITVLEVCPTTNSWSSELKILAPYSQFSLPVTCKITSPLLNCSAVSIKTNKTGEHSFPDLRMKIQNLGWSQKKDKISQDKPNQLIKHIPCAGITILIIAAVLTGIKILKTIANYASRKARSDIQVNYTPSAPYNPEIFITPSSEITQEANRLNQAMESNIRDRTNTINQAVNFNQLMGFDTEDLTQDLLEEYLMSAMEMREPRPNVVLN